MNADGTVFVGKSIKATGETHAFLIRPGLAMTDLNTYLPALGVSNLEGWILTEANGVSADGLVIVGTGRHNGTSEAWIATLPPIIIKQIETRESHVTNGTANSILHHTDLYRLPHAPITTPPSPPHPDDRTLFRRGQFADVDIEVYQPFDPAQTRLNLAADHTFNGATPVRINIPLYDTEVPAGAWGCTMLSLDDGPTPATRIARLHIQIPPTAAIGQYAFSVIPHCVPGNSDLTPTLFPKPVVILFNPWDPNDAVYLSSAAEREEYVLRESGAMWKGFARSRRPQAWFYNQFASDSLLVTIDLLQGLTAAERADGVAVSERLALRIRNRDTGVLFGLWDGIYSGGSDPRIWSRSDEIFARYRSTGATVRYGQCWVFGGLLTSSLRTLGIPARPVSNFESAHAEDATNLVVGSCWRYDPGLDEWDIDGRVWNFHVWCEGWMPSAGRSTRWHVLDATYEIGPLAVSSVLARDTSTWVGQFVLGEVDADVETRIRTLPATTCGPVERMTDWVGRRITTLEAGSYAFRANDITATYKTPESPYDPRTPDEIEINAPADSPIGSPILGNITVRNFDTQAHDFTCYMHVRALAQNGDDLGLVLNPRTESLSIAANGSAVVAADVPWAGLQPWMNATDVVEYVVVLTRLNDGERWFKRSLVRVRGLPITVTLAPAGEVRQPAAVVATVTYSNPLQVPLHAGTLTLTGGSGLLINGSARSEEINLGPLAPGETALLTRTLSAPLVGDQMFSAHWFVPGTIPGDAMASVTVLSPCPADFNNDGGVDSDDVIGFFGAWDINDPAADFNNDGGVDSDDVIGFFASWDAGC